MQDVMIYCEHGKREFLFTTLHFFIVLNLMYMYIECIYISSDIILLFYMNFVPDLYVPLVRNVIFYYGYSKRIVLFLVFFFHIPYCCTY